MIQVRSQHGWLTLHCFSFLNPLKSDHCSAVRGLHFVAIFVVAVYPSCKINTEHRIILAAPASQKLILNVKCTNVHVLHLLDACDYLDHKPDNLAEVTLLLLASQG